MKSDNTLLQAIERLRDEWLDLFGDDAEKLAQRLANTPRDNPQAVRRLESCILDLLSKHPQAHQRLGRELKIKESPTRGVYECVPGRQGEVTAHTLMVCPKDPTHYQKPLRQQGQKLYCPEHDVELVPVDSLSSKQ